MGCCKTAFSHGFRRGHTTRRRFSPRRAVAKLLFSTAFAVGTQREGVFPLRKSAHGESRGKDCPNIWTGFATAPNGTKDEIDSAFASSHSSRVAFFQTKITAIPSNPRPWRMPFLPMASFLWSHVRQPIQCLCRCCGDNRLRSPKACCCCTGMSHWACIP